MFPLFLITVFEKFINGFFIPHANMFQLKTYAGVPVYGYFYLAFFLALGVTIIVCKIRLSHFYFQKVSFTIAIALFSLTLFLQTLGLGSFFKNEFKHFHHQSLFQRNALLLNETYFFTEACRKKFPGYHRAQLVTDMDMTRAPEMYLHRVISYHLYPIDLRSRQDVPIEAIVAFHKSHARDFLPENFQILVYWDDNNLLAIRKDLLKE